MKIIFSPSKDMDLSDPISKDWTISKTTQTVVEELKKLSIDNIIKLMKTSEKKSLETLDYIKDFDKEETFKAGLVYKGLAYKALDYKNLSKVANDFLDDNLLILSALYGPISPSTLIKPYRLDFNTPLKIGDKSLSKTWSEEYNQAIEKGDLVFNLASNEFSSLFYKDNYKWIDFVFYEIKDGKRRSHSSLSKKGRGWMVRFIAENNIVSLEDLRSIDDDFIYNEDLSTDSKLVYIKK